MVHGKEKEVKSAMLTLRKYPDILKEKGMGYLEPFVTKDFNTAFTKEIPTDQGLATTEEKSLSKAIANAIPQETAEKCILNQNEKFTPLAKGIIHVPSSMAVAINRMNTINTGEEDRSKQGTFKFFQNTEANEANKTKAKQYTSYLQSNHPFLLPVLATKDNVETLSSIVAPAEGFDLTKYSEEVQTTIDIKQQLSEMYKDGTLNDDALDKLNTRAENIPQKYIDAEIMKKIPRIEREKQPNPFPTPHKKPPVRRPSISNYPERPMPNLRRNSEHSLGR